MTEDMAGVDLVVSGFLVTGIETIGAVATGVVAGGAVTTDVVVGAEEIGFGAFAAAFVFFSEGALVTATGASLTLLG